MSDQPTIESKQVQEFGTTVTLYRAVDTEDARFSSLWHSTPQAACDVWSRRKWALTYRKS